MATELHALQSRRRHFANESLLEGAANTRLIASRVNNIVSKICEMKDYERSATNKVHEQHFLGSTNDLAGNKMKKRKETCVPEREQNVGWCVGFDRRERQVLICTICMVVGETASTTRHHHCYIQFQ